MKVDLRARDGAVYSALESKFSGIDSVPEIVWLVASDVDRHRITCVGSIVEAMNALLGTGSKSEDEGPSHPPAGKKRRRRIIGADGEIDLERDD